MIETIIEVISSLGSDINGIDQFLRLFFEQLFQMYIEHPIFKLILAFIPAILAMAYPIILQTISRLDNQYNSSRIIAKFHKEGLHKAFLWLLIIAVFSAILCFTLYWFFFILAFLSTIALLIVFFFYMRLLFRYLNGSQLFRHYSKRIKIDTTFKKYENPKNIERTKKKILAYWNEIHDIFIYSIKLGNRDLEETIRQGFIYPSFGFIALVEQKDEPVVEYPKEFYNSAFDTVSKYLKSEEEDYYQNVEIFCGSIFFTKLPGSHGGFLHPDSMMAIWRNLILLLEHDRLDKIIQYWSSAHQYCEYELRIPIEELDEDFKETQNSIQRRKTIETQQKTFITLHYFLGAYLMHKELYKTMFELWFYSNSQPPRYVLVPASMDQIFQYYFDYLEINFRKQDSISYWFKDLEYDAMNNKPDVKSKLRQYTGLLFLRQWIIGSRGYNQDPLRFPSIPVKQSVKKTWVEHMDYFKHIVEGHLNNSKVLESLKLEIITEENCKERGILYPTQYLDVFKKRIKEAFDETIKIENLDKEKVKEIDDFAIESIKNLYESCQRITNKETIKEKDRDELSNTMEAIRGTTMILNREAFIKNTSQSYIDFNRIVPSTIVQEYYAHISSKFHFNAKNRIEVPHGLTFGAIDRLSLDGTKHIIVSFRKNLDYYKDYQKVEIIPGLNNEDYIYNGVKIFCIESSHSLTINKLYVLRLEDTPMINHIDWSSVADELKPEVKEYWESMEVLDKDLALYKRIRDINRHPDLKEKYFKEGHPQETLEISIEVVIDFIGHCWFKKGIKMVEIREGRIFQESGSNNPLDFIKPFHKY